MILQSYIKLFRSATGDRRNCQYLALNVNQALKAIGSTEVVVDDDVATFIDDLRGLNGLHAKRKAFNFVVSGGKYTYEDLIKQFPNYFTRH